VNGQVLRQGERLAAKPTLAQPVFVLQKKKKNLSSFPFYQSSFLAKISNKTEQ
jgi:hypothetical protein